MTQQQSLVTHSTLKRFSRGNFRKITLWCNPWRISCENDIQAWLIFYALLGLSLKCCQEIWVFINLPLLLWYRAPFWVPHWCIHTLNSLIGTHKSSYLLFPFSYKKSHDIKFSFVFPPRRRRCAENTFPLKNHHGIHTS